ncbi:MAG TPA: hypothetical protein VH442_20270 [Micromonosporaceae bacterium]
MSGVRARKAGAFGTLVGPAVVLVALLSACMAACMADRIAIPDAATAPTGNAQPVSPATERATITPDTATLTALARDDGQPLTTSVRLRDGTIFVEPPSRRDVPHVPVATAHAATLAEPGSTDPASLTCRIGILTDTEITDTAGNLIYDQVPVWMCFWVNAIVGPSATPREHENILTFVDAATGRTLFATADTA